MNAVDLKSVPQVPDSKFRLGNKQIHLTYKSHIDAEDYLAWFRDYHDKYEITQFSIVNETGETDYEHTHVLLRFNRMFQTRNCRTFDYNEFHPNIRKVTTKAHWNNVVKYHTKQGTPYTNIEGVRSAREDILDIWSHDTLAAALLNCCKSVKEIGGTIAAFNCKPIDYGTAPDVVWRPWQARQKEIMDGPAHPDHIDWIYDPVGLAGKSFFAKHMGMYEGTFVTTTGNVYHVATQLQKVIEQSPESVLAVIFNFTRQKECHKVYDAIEALKDGMVSTQKYRGETLYLKETPHVVVFANYLPHLHHISARKWNLKIIDEYGQDFTAIATGEWIDWYIRKYLHDNDLHRFDKQGTREACMNIIDSIRQEYGSAGKTRMTSIPGVSSTGTPGMFVREALSLTVDENIPGVSRIVSIEKIIPNWDALPENSRASLKKIEEALKTGKPLSICPLSPRPGRIRV